MRRDKAIANMLGAGLDSDLAEHAVNAGYSLTDLRNATLSALQQTLGSWRANKIRETLARTPIDGAVVLELIERCDWSCCVCWNIDDRSPVILHHLEEHARGGDDTYGNLVVLCLNHHALAHSRWDISRHPTPTGFLRERKENFEAAVAAFKRGERPAPGREGTSTHPAGQLDVEALRQIAQFLDRPAVFRPFEQEGNMHDFLAAMEEVIKALNTGYLQTREGDGFRRTQAIREFSNPEWQEKLLLVRDQLDITRARVETAIRKGDLLVHPDGFYVFRNRQLPEEIDSMRRTAVLILNGVLSEAGIPPVKPPQRERYA
jgi:hypothetical protein